MKKHVEIKTIEHKGINVTIKIDYDKGTASLVDARNMSGNYPAKQWVFAERGLEYMNGWLDILYAMTEAVRECKKDLEFSLAQSSAFKDRLVEMATPKLKNNGSRRIRGNNQR